MYEYLFSSRRPCFKQVALHLNHNIYRTLINWPTQLGFTNSPLGLVQSSKQLLAISYFQTNLIISKNLYKFSAPPQVIVSIFLYTTPVQSHFNTC